MTLPDFFGDEVSVVVKGVFNPALFSPAWLLSQDLIGSSEHSNSQVRVINRDVAIFKSGWLRCQVTKDGLQMSTDDFAEFERVRDAVIGALRALEHTPIAAMGLNREIRFSTGSSAKWHAIGDRLAPKKSWEGALRLPGLINLSMQGARSDKYDGRIVVQVTPVSQPEWGVLVAVNNHFTLVETARVPSTRDEHLCQPDSQLEFSAAKIQIATKILIDKWSDSLKFAEQMVSDIASLAVGRR